MPIESLERHRPRRQLLTKFYIFCEGKNTEPGYFRALNDEIGRDQVIINPVFSGDPKNILTAAIKKRAALEAENAEIGITDQVWGLFDEDGRHDYIATIKNFQEAKVECAPSNVCFELWLLCHHVNEFPTGNQDAIIARLAQLDNTYDKRSKLLNFKEIVKRRDAAEKHALQAAKQAIAAQSAYGRGTTYVFRLTAAIASAQKRFNGGT